MKTRQAIEHIMAAFMTNTLEGRRAHQGSQLRRGVPGGLRRPGRRPAVWLLAGALVSVALVALTWDGQRAKAQTPTPTQTVNQPDDAGDGVCDSTCTLRDAVLAANATPGADVINFDPALTTITLEGQILIAGGGGALNINGNGANIFTIDGGPDVNRIFFLNAANVTITDVTLTGGEGGGTFFGTFGDAGGAIAGYACTLLLDRVHVTNNTPDSDGGGIYLEDGHLRIRNSAISYNVASVCGGINVGGPSSSLQVVNSTISGNWATSGTGGGVCTTAPADFRNVTISGNQASQGGGIFQTANTLSLVNTIVSGNTAGSFPEIFLQGGTVNSTGYNLIGDSAGDAASTNLPIMFQTTDILDTAPLLTPLGDYGGPTPTHAIQLGSPAADAGRQAFAIDFDGLPLQTDQRGNGFPRLVGNGVDMGAFEVQNPPPTPTPDAATSFVVNSANDPGTGVCDATECTLREAIAAANGDPGAETITFDPAAFAAPGPHTINLSGALPDLSSDMAIQGPGANVLTVRRDTGGAYRIFTVSTPATVTISGLTISNGDAMGNTPDDSGGGILNLGTLTLMNSTVSNNRAFFCGGGICNWGSSATAHVINSRVTNNESDFNGGGIENRSTLTVRNSTVSGNRARWDGGGIQNANFVATACHVINSTVSGNTAVSGGGIYSGSPLTLTSSTVSGNSSAGEGGGLYVHTGTSTLLQNVIVADNYLGSGPTEDDVRGGTLDPASSFNLIGTGGGGGLANGGNNNQVGVANPGLGLLASNGGFAETHAPQSGSPAVDAGNSFGHATDQRGSVRPFDLASIPNASDGSDIGAHEFGSPASWSAATLLGTNVSVTAGPVTVNYSGVTQAGVTTVEEIDPATAGTLPGGFSFGPGLPAYEITTTAQYTPPVTVCIQVPGVSDPTQFATLSIFHYENGMLVDKTVSRDSLARKICASVSSLSPFVVAQLLTPAGDMTAPAVTISAPLDGATFVKGQAVTADYSCQDEAGGSGLASCTGTVADGALIDTSTVGSHTFAVTGADVAGNSATATSTYNVVYDFSGFLQPVENLPMLNIAKAGSAIPVKFSLGGNQGLAIFAAGYPASSPIPCDASEPGTVIEETVAAGSSSLSYDATTGQYKYVWKTERAWKGTCRMLVVRFNDGAEHLAKFRLN
jgi:CSLREA domain-containing protein